MTKLWLRLGLTGLICCGAITTNASAEPAIDLPGQARAILKKRCYSCHGEGGANEGGFNYVLNRKRLTRELIVQGLSDDSKLFQRVFKGEMPPDGDRVSPEELETLRQWIDNGAPSFSAEENRDFIHPNDFLEQIRNDLDAADERDRPFYRYFTLTHLYNAGFEDNELETYRQGLSKLVNSLSWGREINTPHPIDPFKTILRIDIRHYKWNENNAWDQIIAADPYHVTYSSDSARACYKLSGCDLPHVRADWFVFAASRPPLYHDILGIPKQASELEKLLGVNVAKNLVDFNDVLRAAFDRSGVSSSNRVIERHSSYYGAYWKSYDFKPINADNPRRGHLKDTPLGPTPCGGVVNRERFFEHDGGEIIFNLPNGLQAYMLIDAQGERIDKGPTDVVVDKESVKRGRNPDVVNGVSCMSCHWSGMLNKTDQVRDHVLSRKTAYTVAEVAAVTALYPTKVAFAARMKEDRERFEAAVLKCGAPLAKSEPVSTLAYQFDEPLDLDLAASEAGVLVNELTVALDADPALARMLGGLTQGQPVPRDTYVQTFGKLIAKLDAGKYVPAVSTSTIADTSKPITPTGASTKTSPPLPPPTIDIVDGNRAGEERADNVLEMTFVWCPAGEFNMGSPALDNHADADEKPQVRVELTRGFWLGKHEVTQWDWERIMETRPWADKDRVKEEADCAASYVSWDDAVAFCAKLTKQEQKAGRLSASETYRLPGEAEWEYACRAGTTTRFSFGDDEEQLSAFGWWGGSIGSGNANTERYAHHAGLQKPNAWGLCDMHGNVCEWCLDWHGDKLPGGRDPAGPTRGSHRVSRGGSWSFVASACRSAFRGRYPPDFQDNYQGFRVVRGPSGK